MNSVAVAVGNVLIPPVSSPSRLVAAPPKTRLPSSSRCSCCCFPIDSISTNRYTMNRLSSLISRLVKETEITTAVEGPFQDNDDDENEKEEEEAIHSSQKSISPRSRRRLILLRHADSLWPQDKKSVRDHDRPLSKAGQADAIQVSYKLQQLGWVPDLILSSDAARTKETLEIMQQKVRGFLDAEVHFISSFYSIAAMDGQTAEHLQHAIYNFSRDDILTVMCMGHNRGWEEAASVFSGKPIELKTCNAALLEATGETWKEAFSLAGFGGWKLQGVVKPH